MFFQKMLLNLPDSFSQVKRENQTVRVVVIRKQKTLCDNVDDLITHQHLSIIVAKVFVRCS